MAKVVINNFKLYNDNIKRALENNKFEELKNTSILITGANGLIASAIIDILNYLNVNFKYNIEIIALVRNKDNLLNRFKSYKNLMIIEQDVVNKIELNKKVDYIIHAASNAHPKAYSQDPVGTMLANFLGMNNIMEFAISNSCKRVEYISSGEVYGQPVENIDSFSEDYIGEIDSTNPRSCYPLSKLASETLCVSYSKQYNIETVIARPCHVYGPTQSEKDTRVSAQFVNNILKNENIVMKSEGLQTRSYCYVLDCATAIITILLYGKSSNAYNISNSNSVITIRKMAEIMTKMYGKELVIELPTDAEKSGYSQITRAVLNSSKLEKLGWKANWNFEDGIRETIEIMK